MMNVTMKETSDAGNPHVRFEEVEVASVKPRRGSLLYKVLASFALGTVVCRAFAADEVPWIDLTNTNRVCMASGSAVFQSKVFDNDWFASLVSNTLCLFSSKEPTGLLLILK